MTTEKLKNLKNNDKPKALPWNKPDTSYLDDCDKSWKPYIPQPINLGTKFNFWEEIFNMLTFWLGLLVVACVIGIPWILLFLWK